MPPPHLVVRGDEAHDAAHAALHRRVQAEEAHVLGRAEVIAIVRVEALLGVGDVRAHAIAGRPPEIAHVIDHGAVPLLRDGPGDQRGQEPEDRDGLLAPQPIERQAVHDGEARAVVEHGLEARRRAAAMGELEVGGSEREHGQGIGAKRLHHRLDLGHAFRPEQESALVHGARSSASRRRATRCPDRSSWCSSRIASSVAASGVIEARAAMRQTSTPVIAGWPRGLGACRRNPARAMRRVQLRGGARRQPARRTFCTLSRLSRAPTKQMGPYHRSS